MEANIKIVKNGSYSFDLEGGTVLNITVYVAPCARCQQTTSLQSAAQHVQQQRKMNHDAVPLGSATCTSGEYAQTVQPFHHKSTSPTSTEQVCEG